MLSSLLLQIRDRFSFLANAIQISFLKGGIVDLYFCGVTIKTNRWTTNNDFVQPERKVLHESIKGLTTEKKIIPIIAT